MYLTLDTFNLHILDQMDYILISAIFAIDTVITLFEVLHD